MTRNQDIKNWFKQPYDYEDVFKNHLKEFVENSRHPKTPARGLGGLICAFQGLQNHVKNWHLICFASKIISKMDTVAALRQKKVKKLDNLAAKRSKFQALNISLRMQIWLTHVARIMELEHSYFTHKHHSFIFESSPCTAPSSRRLGHVCEKNMSA